MAFYARGMEKLEKTKLNFQDFNKKSREGIYVGPPQADSQILFVRYLDPSFHGRGTGHTPDT
jgi:hypothetical protein